MRRAVIGVVALAVAGVALFLVLGRGAGPRPEALPETARTAAPAVENATAPSEETTPPAPPATPIAATGGDASQPVASASRPAAPPNSQLEAMRQAMKRFTPRDLALYAQFHRMGVEAPPETKTLIERRRAGATVAELEAYVRDAFPEDARVRLVATQWIRSGAPLTPTTQRR
jgi:hypothetical protein